MAKDDKVILTAEQAISLLPEGENIHNYANPNAGMMIGCDYSRESAMEALRKAFAIELGGEQCKRMKHPIVCWDSKSHYTFFEADMAKVEALEAEREAA